MVKKGEDPQPRGEWGALRFIIFPCFGQDSEHIDSGEGKEEGSPGSGVLPWVSESPTPPSRSQQVQEL